MNYQSVKPYEKNLRDKSVVKNSKVKKTGSKSITKKTKKNKSVAVPWNTVTSTQGVPLSKSKIAWKSVVSRKSVVKQKPKEKSQGSFKKSVKKSTSKLVDLN